jgi:hypothetical protein
MDMSTPASTALSSRARRRARLLESPRGTGGPGRMVERWLWLWRWETWASDSQLRRRPRAGWSLTYRGALISSQDALDDYELAAGVA